MNNITISGSENRENQPFEIVERKGSGHPDTLADDLGEKLSVVYSKYTKEKFGAILHHNFDKVGMMGGRSNVTFNGGGMIEPIRVIINGRASSKFGNEVIPVRRILEQTVKEFFSEKFEMLDVEKDLRIIYEVSSGSSPGGIKEKESDRHYWFEPRTLDDLPELKKLACNDTSMGCAFAPFTKVEALVLGIETLLNSEHYKSNKPWLGSDIKIMANRLLNEIHITMCVPQKSQHVRNVTEYNNNLLAVRKDVLSYCEEKAEGLAVELSINTRDDVDKGEFYLTFTGSSIESGDEGFVGRGNRISGLITPLRPYSMEGICGKNPVYHTGKLYSIASQEIAWAINEEFGVGAEVWLIGQSGQLLTDPWKTIVRVEGIENIDKEKLERVIRAKLNSIPNITGKILGNEYVLA